MSADRRPHSRACGITIHDHGLQCSPDCPTCATPFAALSDSGEALAETMAEIIRDAYKAGSVASLRFEAKRLRSVTAGFEFDDMAATRRMAEAYARRLEALAEQIEKGEVTV